MKNNHEKEENLNGLIEERLACEFAYYDDYNKRFNKKRMNKKRMKELSLQIQAIISDKVSTIYELQNQIQEIINYLKAQIPTYEHIGYVYFESIDIVKLTKEQLDKLDCDPYSCLQYSIKFDEYEGDSCEGYIYVPTGKKNEFFKIPYSG